MNWGFAFVTMTMFPVAAAAALASPVVRTTPVPHLVMLAALYVVLALATAVGGAAFGIGAICAMGLTLFLVGRAVFLLVTGRFRDRRGALR